MKKIKHIFISTLLKVLLLTCLHTYGQPDLKFEHFNDDKGLTQNSIVDLVQDDDGYLWIATANGLYKYDGLSFTVYRNEFDNPNSLVNDIITKLALDKEGNLLIGTSRGLCMFNKLTGRFKELHTSLANKSISAIYPDKDGSMWVGTKKSGLYHLLSIDNKNEGVEHYFYQPNQFNGINDNAILSLNRDGNGSLWIGTSKGLNKMLTSKSGNKFISISGIEEQVNTLFLDKRNRLWVGADGEKLLSIEKDNALNAKDFSDFKTHFLSDQEGESQVGIIYGIQEGKDGNLWVAILDRGLYWYNHKTDQSKLYAPEEYDDTSISSRRLKSILLDSTNVLWVGTYVGGLNKTDLEAKNIDFFTKNLYNKNSFSDPSINGMLEDNDGVFWIGTENGLNRIRFNGEAYSSPEFEHYLNEKNRKNLETGGQNSIWCIYKDSDNDYWIGGKTGITHMRLNPVTKEPEFTKTPINTYAIYSIIEDADGYLWFGSFEAGLSKWKKKKKRGENSFDFSEIINYKSDFNNPKSISDDLICSLFKDSKQNIWIGTLQGGLNLYVPESNKGEGHFISFQNTNDSKSISNNAVFSIYEDKKNNYWIGTFGGGLNKMTKSGDSLLVFKPYRVKDGLANNAVYGVLEDDYGVLWMSTDEGVSSFNPIDETFKNYNKGDGLQSNNFRINAYLKSKSGHLFFGGLRGLNIFHPQNLKGNSYLPSVKITKFKIKGEDVVVGDEFNERVLLNKSISFLEDEVKLKYHENTLTFHFAALHFAAPEKNKFKYKLEGFDDDWIDSKGLSLAHYTNLSAGKYVFKVKASNNDGVWNEEPSILKFKIEPSFWYTRWAFLLYSMVLIGILWGIISYFKLQSKERAAVKLQKEIESVNKLKLQFFTSISHDFKTPITLILNPLEEVLKSEYLNSKIKPKLKVIERNANSLLRLVNQLMEFRKIEVGETKLRATKADIIGFVREIVFSFRATAKKQNIDIIFDTKLYREDVWFDWDKLEKILNNIIYNAIKFTALGGEIEVRLKRPRDRKTIEIREKGVSVNYLQIEIEDNGVGIEKEQMPYVFQRFYQVNKFEDSEKSGSGIGLAIAKDLVDLHYGEIEVMSQLGKGTSFIIKLPLGKEHLSANEIIEVPAPMPLTETEMDADYDFQETNLKVDEKRKFTNSVLIVDDNKDIRELVKNGLLENYNVFEAENGKEGLNIALKEIPDLVVSDVLMPEMDGIEFCHNLKTHLRTSHIPIILLTALNSVEHRIKGLESGADAYIPKPFKMELLKVRVDKLIESREKIRKRFQTEKELTPEKVTLNSLDEEFLKRIMDLMEANMNNDSYWIDQLVSDMHSSRSTFFRKLKKLTGQSPNDFIRLVRMKRAAQLLEENQLTIAQVSNMVGFNDPNYFSKCFRKTFGVVPSKYCNSLGAK